ATSRSLRSLSSPGPTMPRRELPRDVGVYTMGNWDLHPHQICETWSGELLSENLELLGLGLQLLA
ncbi:MAG: hypothetical protein WC683_20565, partial [bacterium]